MQIKRIASAVAVAGLIAAGSATAANAYEPSNVDTDRPRIPSKVVSPEANRSVVESAEAVAGAGAGDELAYTGSDALIGAGVGALLILGGAGAVLASRRRATN